MSQEKSPKKKVANKKTTQEKENKEWVEKGLHILDQVNNIFDNKELALENYGIVYEDFGDDMLSDDIITTGSLSLDIALGGGFRSASVSLFYGDKESGKTSQGLSWGRNWQKHYGEKGWVVFFDAEGRLTNYKKKASGIDSERLILVRSNASEAIFRTIQTLILENKEDNKYFFIIDSVNAMTVEDERKKVIGEMAAVAGGARINSAALKRLSLPIHTKGHHLYICSQERVSNITGSGKKSSPSGGKAPGFYGDTIAKMGLAFKANSPQVILDGDKQIGRITSIKFEKTANEETSTSVDVPIKFKHTGGIWSEYDTINCAIAWGLILKRGAWYSFSDTMISLAKDKLPDLDLSEVKVQGVMSLATYLEQIPDVNQLIIGAIKEMAL